MKTLAKVTKVEDGITYYDEICRETNEVMCSDYQTTERFEYALNCCEFGFELYTPIKKAVCIKRVKAGKDLDGNQVCKGSVMLTVECSTQQLADKIDNLLTWNCIEETESDHYLDGVSLVYWMDTQDVEEFRSDVKAAKKEVM